MFSDRNRRLATAILAATLALGGATAASAKEKTPRTDPTTLKATGEPRNCISGLNVNTVQSGTSALMFRESANKWYRNDLRNNCPALRSDRVLVFRNQTSGSQYCEMDSFDVVDTMTRSSFGMCTLGKFTPVEVPKGTKF
jgi:hypothetical protein